MNIAQTNTPDTSNQSTAATTGEAGVSDQAADAGSAVSLPNVVVLDVPLKRGTGFITEITLRKPNAGELRGLSLQRLHQADADELLKLLPRITTPSLTGHECAQLDPADLSEAGGIVISFLLKKSLRDAVLQSA